MGASEIIPGPFGEIEIFANDTMIREYLIRHGAYQLSDMLMLRALVRPDERILDLGSHVGSFAVPLAKAASDGDITCVEANPETAAMVERNLARNGIARFRVINRPIATSNLRLAAARPLSDQAANTGGLAWREAGPSEGAVAITLDEVLAEVGRDITLVKIDIEGWDYRIVDAIRPGMFAAPPVLFFEAHGIGRQHALVGRLIAQGYRLFVNATPAHSAMFGPLPVRIGAPGDLGPFGGRVDLLCVPGDRALPPGFGVAPDHPRARAMQAHRRGDKTRQTAPVGDDPLMRKIHADLELRFGVAGRAAALVSGDFPGRDGWHDYLLAQALRRDRRHSEALVAAKAAADALPDDLDAADLLANCLMAVGKTREAEAVLARAIRHVDVPAKLHGTQSRLMDMMGRPEAAIAAARHLVRKAPKTPRHKWWLAQLLHRADQSAEAEALVLAALEASPGTPAFLATLREIRGEQRLFGLV